MSGLLIYTQHITPRLEYAAKIIFKTVINLDYRITHDKSELSNYQGVKINYYAQKTENALHIKPSSFLFKTGLEKIEVDHKKWGDLSLLFPQEENEDFPFDIFSAVFFMASRYEEWLDFESDDHGRFPLIAQTSYKHGFHQKAIVHRWTNFLMKQLEKKFGNLVFEQRTFHFQPSFDIDNAFAIKNKGMLRTAGSMLKNLHQVFYRLRVLMGLIPDPYDNFEYLEKVNSAHGIEGLYFILCSDRGRYDRNIPPESPAFKELVASIGEKNMVGIHPSYRSNEKKDQLKNEKNKLSEMLGREVLSSRQHYLILEFPATYANLMEASITDDFSMGFAEEAGFRSGLAIPYPYFNLKENKEEKFTIHPFQFMESSYMYYHRADRDKALADLNRVIEETKEVDGEFISIWHNESLGEWSYWKGWRRIFEYMYKKCIE